MIRVRLLLIISFAAFACCLPGTAAVISAGTQVSVANGGTAPGSPFDYDFFGGKPSVLTDFTVNLLTGSQFGGNGSYTTVIAPDGTGPFTTGIAYDNNSITPPVLMATFSPTSNGGFTVWILDGNTDGNQVGNTTVGLGVNNGTPVSTATVLSGTNEFTEYYVSGALTSDVFDVYATPSNSNHPSISGLTFTAPNSAAPEPSAFALGLGAICLLAGRLRKPAPRA